MKLRIQGNSLRLRLSPSDLRTFATAGRVQERLCFAGGRRLTYALQASGEAHALTARFDGEAITVLLPSAWVIPWLDTDRVGFQHTQRLDDETELGLLVEKDFQCLHKPAGEQDAFPHPQ